MRDYQCLVASTTTTGTWNGLKKVVKYYGEDLDVGQVRYDEGWPYGGFTLFPDNIIQAHVYSATT